MDMDKKRARQRKWVAIKRARNAAGDVISVTEVPRPKLKPIEIKDATVKFATTVYNRDGKADRQFVRTEPSKVARLAVWEEIGRQLREGIVPLPPAPPRPAVGDGELLTAYPIGDHHLGMLSWKPETGADYDVTISERLLADAMADLVRRSPSSSTALVAFLGDFFHYDSFDTLTPEHKNLLDSDTRFPRMVRAGLRLIQTVIGLALAKHELVHVIFEPGNHDPASTVWITETMALLYSNEPRVHVDTSPKHVHYFQFGKVLIGTHHGDKTKMADLPLLMASDRPVAWGETEHRHWYTGHRHHQETTEIQGVLVEMFGVLPPADAYAAHHGYRQKRQMKAITYHELDGEVSRLTVTPKMLEAK